MKDESMMKIKNNNNMLLKNYHQIDNKCQSFKSFLKLIENNQMFKELLCDKSPNVVNLITKLGTP